MAESTGNPKLEVEIGADISQLQSSIIAAENELRGFQAEIKKTTDTGRIAELSRSIENTQQKIAGMRQEMGKSAGASNQAINALGNVSRVAQDASYGFMGIANNLNPLFESFQRLQASSGGTGNALKQMGAALTGPAGIGLAIGVVSSLIVSFGDDISKFITEKAGTLGESFRKESDLISKGGDAYVKATTDIDKLRDSYEDFQNGFITKESFLKKFNETLGDTIKETKDLSVAEKFLGDYADDYVQMTFKKSVANLAAAEAAKKQFEIEVARNKPNAAFTNTYENLFFAGKDIETLGKVTKDKLIKKANEDITIFEIIRAKFDKEADKMQEVLVKMFGVPTGGIKKDTTEESDFKIMAKQELADTERWVAKLKKNLKESQEVLKNERIKLFTLPSERRAEESKRRPYFDKQIKELTEQSNEKGLGAFLMKDAKSRIKDYDLEEKKIKELAASYENFANMLASNLTSGIMDVFAAFEAGTSPLEAIADMFLNIAKSIAAAVIQATIFEAILTAFPELKAIFAASGALQSAFGGKKLAAGGITNGASIAMIGEAGPEAILPLSRLNTFMQTSFNAGAMSGGGRTTGGSSVAVLRGQDLLVAINRTQKSSSLKGQNISLI
jgi:hypothetical protein